MIIDRRRHRGPFRIFYMEIQSFMRRYLRIG
jgi:hypothetical protein